MLVAWFIVVGTLLILMAFGARWLERMPVSPALLYLASGAALAAGTPLLSIDPVRDRAWIEVLAEVTVLISLFAVGLKLPLSLPGGVWRSVVRLATSTMVLCTGLAALLATVLFGMAWPAALLLGAIVAPTDPVLASDVQVRGDDDRDRLRMMLSAEGGLNDGTAFPLVMLALGLAGLHDIGEFGWRWIAVDLAWAAAGAILLGHGWALLLQRLLVALRPAGDDVIYEEYLVVGAIALVYGSAQALGLYGFLAVFWVGLALRRRQPPHGAGVLRFTGQLERLAEVAMVLIVGALLVAVPPDATSLAFGMLLLLVVRPASVLLGLAGVQMPSPGTRHYIAWFGIRGIGSLYYLAVALRYPLDGTVATEVTRASMTAVGLSIILHGLSATPLMRHRDSARSR